MEIHNVSIDLSKIDQSRVKEKDGHRYYNVSVIVSDKYDEYGNNVAICQSQTKEEREAKQRVYLGNGKTVYNKKK